MRGDKIMRNTSISHRSLRVGTDVQRHLFNVDEYYRLAEAGILAPDARVELIDGEIVEMSAIGSRHAACVDRLNVLLHDRLHGRSILRVQGPVRLNLFSEPLPDVAVLKPRPDFYASAHPGPADVLLVVEVADSSLKYDRDIKASLYSRAGIAEMWLVDLEGQVIHVFTQPSDAGYQRSATCRRGERVPTLALGPSELLVDDILG